MGTWDQFAKEIIPTLLEGIGQVETSVETQAEPQHIDLFVRPQPTVDWNDEFVRLGWLSRIARQPCLIEPYSKTVSARDVRTCLRKQITQEHRLLKKDADAELPHLWLLSAGDARQASEGFCLEPRGGWPTGFRFCVPALKLCVVVLSALPRDRSALPLRLLGRGKTLAEALEDVRALPADDLMRRPMMEVLAQRRFAALNSDDEAERAEAKMLQQEWQSFKNQVRQEGLEKGREEGLEKGREEGREEGQRRLVLHLLQMKYGALDELNRSRLESADLPTLERYAERLLTATSLPEVFAD